MEDFDLDWDEPDDMDADSRHFADDDDDTGEIISAFRSLAGEGG